MAKEKKAQIIEQLHAAFAGSKAGVLADYRGLKTPELNGLRLNLKKANVSFHVVKNTLARSAAEKAGKKDLGALFVGPVAVALSPDNDVAPAKVITEYVRSTKVNLQVKGGFLGTQVISAAAVETLAKLPSREVLLSQVLGGIQSPIAALIGCLASPLRGIAGVLQARIKQLEEVK